MVKKAAKSSKKRPTKYAKGLKKATWFNPDSKCLSLTACRKIKPGSFIRVRWIDVDDTVVLVTEKMFSDCRYLDGLDDNLDTVTINHDQIVEVLPQSFMMPRI